MQQQGMLSTPRYVYAYYVNMIPAWKAFVHHAQCPKQTTALQALCGTTLIGSMGFGKGWIRHLRVTALAGVGNHAWMGLIASSIDCSTYK